MSPPQDLYHLTPQITQQNAAVPTIPRQQPPQQQQQQQEDFIRPMMEGRNPIVSHSVNYEPQQVAQYGPLPPQGEGGWIPHQSNQMPSQINQYVGE